MKTYLLILVVFGTFTILHAQTPPPGTTEEEYNYATKGYKVQIESGLDMKKGYKLQDMGEVPEGNYKFSFKLLMREEKEELAGIMVISHSNVSGRTYYMCIPVNNPELYKRYWADLSLWDDSITKPYTFVLSTYFSNTLNGCLELSKKAKK